MLDIEPCFSTATLRLAQATHLTDTDVLSSAIFVFSAPSLLVKFSLIRWRSQKQHFSAIIAIEQVYFSLIFPCTFFSLDLKFARIRPIRELNRRIQARPRGCRVNQPNGVHIIARP